MRCYLFGRSLVESHTFTVRDRNKAGKLFILFLFIYLEVVERFKAQGQNNLRAFNKKKKNTHAHL